MDLCKDPFSKYQGELLVSLFKSRNYTNATASEVLKDSEIRLAAFLESKNATAVLLSRDQALLHEYLVAASRLLVSGMKLQMTRELLFHNDSRGMDALNSVVRLYASLFHSTVSHRMERSVSQYVQAHGLKLLCFWLNLQAIESMKSPSTLFLSKLILDASRPVHERALEFIEWVSKNIESILEEYQKLTTHRTKTSIIKGLLAEVSRVSESHTQVIKTLTNQTKFPNWATAGGYKAVVSTHGWLSLGLLENELLSASDVDLTREYYLSTKKRILAVEQDVLAVLDPDMPWGLLHRRIKDTYHMLFLVLGIYEANDNISVRVMKMISVLSDPWSMDKTHPTIKSRLAEIDQVQNMTHLQPILTHLFNEGKVRKVVFPFHKAKDPFLYRQIPGYISNRSAETFNEVAITMSNYQSEFKAISSKMKLPLQTLEKIMIMFAQSRFRHLKDALDAFAATKDTRLLQFAAKLDTTLKFWYVAFTTVADEHRSNPFNILQKIIKDMANHLLGSRPPGRSSTLFEHERLLSNLADIGMKSKPAYIIKMVDDLWQSWAAMIVSDPVLIRQRCLEHYELNEKIEQSIEKALLSNQMLLSSAVGSIPDMSRLVNVTRASASAIVSMFGVSVRLQVSEEVLKIFWLDLDLTQLEIALKEKVSTELSRTRLPGFKEAELLIKSPTQMRFCAYISELKASVTRYDELLNRILSRVTYLSRDAVKGIQKIQRLFVLLSSIKECESSNIDVHVRVLEEITILWNGRIMKEYNPSLPES